MEIINKEIANDVKDLILTSSGTIVGVSNPLLGSSIIIANECAKKVDTIKLSYLVNALGKGLNEEKYKNMIVTYIGDSNDRAMLVLNTFRKAIIEDSLIAISLMGIILAKNIEANSNPSQDDLIIYKALENATDFDLKIFRKLISSKKTKNDRELEDAELLTCRWCVQNRLFEDRMGYLNVKERYENTNAGTKLFKIMDEVPDYLWD